MDSMEQFLTLLVKEWKENGFVETIKKHGINVFQTGFECIAEIAVLFLKDIVGTCFPCFKSVFDQRKENNNPILEIIFQVMKKFVLPDFKTIVLFIKAAIKLCDQLLQRYRSKPSAAQETALVQYQRIPVPSCKSCPSNDVFTRPQARTCATSTPVTEESLSRSNVVTSGTPTNMNISTQLRANVRTSSTSTNINTLQRANVRASNTITDVSTQLRENVGTSCTSTNINTLQRANVRASNTIRDVSTQQRENVGTSCTSMNIITQLTVDVGTTSTPMNISTQLRVNTGTTSRPMNKSTQRRENIRNINSSEMKSITETIATGLIVGARKMNNTNFKGVERKICYHVGRVYLNTSGQDIIDYLKKTIPDDGSFECVKLASKGRMQSFKVIANLSVKKYLEDPMNWPSGVRVQPWKWKNKTPTTPAQTI